MMITILLGLATLCVFFFIGHVWKLTVFLATSGVVGVFIAATLYLWFTTGLGLIGSVFVLLGGMVLFGQLIGAHSK